MIVREVNEVNKKNGIIALEEWCTAELKKRQDTIGLWEAEIPDDDAGAIASV